MDSPEEDGRDEPTAVSVLARTGAVLTAVALASLFLPPKYAGTVVALLFYGATWLLAIKEADEATLGRSGLELGGLLSPDPISPRRLIIAFGKALGWALLFAALVFPPFWVGYTQAFHITWSFRLRFPPSLLDDVSGQLFSVALPEEAFFRGYLQSEFDRLWPPRFRVFGAQLGIGLVLSSAIFAIGHVLTSPQPSRLAVFFPSLLFGWLRARTGGVGAGVLFHASCNLFSATLARGYAIRF